MNKEELVEAVAKETGLTLKDSKAAVKAMLDTFTKELSKGHDVTLIGFGTFSVVKRAARKGRNPQTGEEIKIPASKTPKFRPGKALKDSVNKRK